MRGSIITKTAVLAAMFLGLILIGRFLITSPQRNNLSKSDVIIDEASTTKSQADSPAIPTQHKTASTDPSEESLASCASRLRQETAAKKREYEKGTLLVTFKTGLTYSQAKDILATYGISVQSEVSSKESFSSRRLITGAFAPGEEFTKICLLRRDERIAYVGLNIIFSLHE